MSWLEIFELLSYVVTIVGFPFAILIFIYEQRKERQNEEEALYQTLSDSYANFLSLVIENADLQLLSTRESVGSLTGEQQERKLAIFVMLVALFERAYILVYEEKMPPQTQRLWQSWHDYMCEWCQRRDFREALPALLDGEDPGFRQYIETLLESGRA